ncbi:tRNA dimethylallyltransferase [Deinococcus reticulitermitis]|uniref:tRNA dimethylallyltransferase n=1 Tax=Deinococcus reticulitermitis TaxID=856736 RepID=A0A1H6VBN2_9DEIO|nr:tRNA dimethylallyltransferase [Deinococcus reticulitermitis]
MKFGVRLAESPDAAPAELPPAVRHSRWWTVTPDPAFLLPLPVLTAPTAAGKTALALQLAAEYAQRRPVEIVAADAFTVYRGLDIGTAKPSAQERAETPHHLLDVVDVTEPYDVARYVRDAEAALAAILRRGHLPLVVGGSGFYLSALARGLPLTPPSDPVARAGIEQELGERGLEALLAEIEAISPREAARMERNPRRVVRALEVHRATGRFPGEFGHSVPAFRYEVFAFTRPPEELERRVAARTASMLRAGWPEEARWLAAQVPPDAAPRPTVWQALGYREALAVAHGQLPLEEAERRITLQTRQYTRRQLTWLRRQLRAELQTPEAALAGGRVGLGAIAAALEHESRVRGEG